mmetsp:Transcript_119420/g.186472  ORF Transcript_119420/g.186472 Transcript_119420/m.186472 type:complete len:210 (-) Transcript_119420:79-708(-)
MDEFKCYAQVSFLCQAKTQNMQQFDTHSHATKPRSTIGALTLHDDLLCCHWVLHILRYRFHHFFLVCLVLRHWLLHKILHCCALRHWHFHIVFGDSLYNLFFNRLIFHWLYLHIVFRDSIYNFFFSWLIFHWLHLHCNLGPDSVDCIRELLLVRCIKASDRGAQISKGHIVHTACIFSQGLGRLLLFLVCCRRQQSIVSMLRGRWRSFA